MYEQYNIFGSIDNIKEEQAKPSPNRYRTMQEMFGTVEDLACGSCRHLIGGKYHNKQYYKCELWHISHSSATDIRLKDKACGKWEK
jgi:hypothetical protein